MTPQQVDKPVQRDAQGHTHDVNDAALRVRYGALPLVLTVQSQMAIGHVGNSLSVPTLQLLGCQVAQVPTALVSNHAGHPTMRGQMLDAALIKDLFRGLSERGVLEHVDFILSGYLGTGAAGAALAEFIDQVRAVNPRVQYVCDPVMGDLPQGFFVPQDVRDVLAQELVPRADVLTPNLFELRHLSGHAAVDEAGVITAAGQLGQAHGLNVIVTGCRLDSTPAEALETFTVSTEGAPPVAHAVKVTSRYVPVAPIGTGDFFAALVTGQLAYGATLPDAVAGAAHTVSDVLAIVESDALGEITLTRPIMSRISSLVTGG